MNSTIRYADLWAFLRKLGFNCEAVRDGTHRICEHTASGSLFTLADYPPEELVREQILYGVRLQLDNFGVMSRDDFDRWEKRQAKANAANNTNVSKRSQQPRASEPHR